MWDQGDPESAPARFEGWECRSGTGQGTVEVALRDTSSAPGEGDGDAEVVIDPEQEPQIDPSADPDGERVSIGCAQTLERRASDALADDAVAAGSTTFLLSQLPPGDYRVSLSATSGIGDGCAGGGTGVGPADRRRVRRIFFERAVTDG